MSGRIGRKWGSPVTYFVALLVIAVCIAPVLYLVLGGFRTNAQITTSPSGLPHPWVVTNYTGVLKSVTFWGEFANSTIVALASGDQVDLHDVMIKSEQANITFQLAVQVRNKVLEAYQEVTRMQI